MCQCGVAPLIHGAYQIHWFQLRKDLDKHWSTTEYVFTLVQAPMCWHCILQSTVALSSTEAEYLAMMDAMKETIWLQGFLNDLGIDQKLLKINCDGMSAIYLVKNQVYHARMKHIDIRLHFVRVTLSYKKFTQRRIPSICLPRLFREWSLHFVRSYSISFKLLELGGSRLDELQMTWSPGQGVRRQPH